MEFFGSYLMQTAFWGKGGGGRVVTTSHDVLVIIVNEKGRQQNIPLASRGTGS
jgi:hypothetical protein